MYQASGATRVPGNRLVYQVRDVSADGVAESLAVPGDTRVRSAVVLGGDASFVQRSGVGYVIDFAPFLLAFNDPAAIKLPAEVIRDVAGDGIFQPVQFRLVPRVVGTTQVKVPAGTFEAIHVSLQGATTVRVNNGTLPGNAHFDIWYAPAAKRWVKLVARVTAGSSSMEDAILELAEFQLGTPGTANPLAAPTPQNRPATQVAVAAPSTAAAALSAAAAALSSLVPKEGDTWTYKHTDTISRVNDSMLVYRVKSVSPNEIEDVLTIPDKVRSPVALAFDAGFAYPVRTGVPFLTPEVAPYLQAFEAMPEGKEWKFSAPVNIQAGNFRFNNDMPFTAVVERREKVTVPAGSFDAIKVLVQGRRSVSGWGQVVFTVRQEVWYAPAVKRFVKLATQMYAGAQTAENTVDELVRYQLN